jgi:dethiobiotin synthetase
MHKIIVAGSGTGVGKTLVSAILATLLEGDYWKPVQCGGEEDSDTAAMKKLIGTGRHRIYPPACSLKAPLSPHHAARLEGFQIDTEAITPPETARPLIIESVGGIFVPLTAKILSIDLFKSWNGQWVIVSKHYLGSINHTLLTIDALKRQHVSIAGLIFNGEPNQDSEAAILEISQLPLLGRLLPEKNLNLQTIQRYAKQWHPCLPRLIP